MQTAENTANSEVWYALRVTYCREMLVKTHLATRGIESYLPMCEAERPYGAVMRRVQVSLIHNLIFVRITAEMLKHLKTTTLLPIQYIINRVTKAPVTVPDNQMQSFMLATRNGQAEVAEPQQISLLAGDRVRVIKGAFAGIEGRYIRHDGIAKIAIEIDGIATILTASIQENEIEKILNND